MKLFQCERVLRIPNVALEVKNKENRSERVKGTNPELIFIELSVLEALATEVSIDESVGFII